MSVNHQVKVERYNIDIPNWDKILFPDKKLTKSDLVHYYQKISSHILKYLEGHLLTLQRFPNGINQDGFYQKEYQKYYPAFLNSRVIDLVQGGKQKQVLCNKEADLIYLVGQGTIALHSWLSKINAINKPSRLLFDLDPPDTNNNMSKLIKASKTIKKALDEFELPCFVMTSGSRGLHVVTPIRATQPFDAMRDFVKNIAYYIVANNTTDFTINLNKKKRNHKIFLDYTRNAYGQTSIVPYSLRALATASIATPLSWDELDNLKSSQDYTIDNIFKRLSKISDPWHDFFQSSNTITKKMLNKAAKLAEKSK